MEKKKSFGYSPNIITQEQIDKNMRRAMSQGRQQQKPISFAPKGQQQGTWRPPQSKSIAWKPPQPVRQQEQPQSQPMFQQQQPVPMEPVQQEEEPYWSAEEWEDWCVDIYKNYPEMRKYLPAWFIEAIEA